MRSGAGSGNASDAMTSSGSEEKHNDADRPRDRSATRHDRAAHGHRDSGYHPESRAVCRLTDVWHRLRPTGPKSKRVQVPMVRGTTRLQRLVHFYHNIPIGSKFHLGGFGCKVQQWMTEQGFRHRDPSPFGVRSSMGCDAIRRSNSRPANTGYRGLALCDHTAFRSNASSDVMTSAFIPTGELLIGG